MRVEQTLRLCSALSPGTHRSTAVTAIAAHSFSLPTVNSRSAPSWLPRPSGVSEYVSTGNVLSSTRFGSSPIWRSDSVRHEDARAPTVPIVMRNRELWVDRFDSSRRCVVIAINSTRHLGTTMRADVRRGTDEMQASHHALM
jgi:hypothetical protein